MAHYLVTGGAGFIGSHLVESLISHAHRVRVLDNLSTGRPGNLPAQANLIIGDVTDKIAVQMALDDVDGCFHLAAVASVELCREDWLRSHMVNLGGTINVFEEVCRRQKQWGRSICVVYASSAAVYGSADEIPISEQASPHPANSYGVDKLGCELHATVADKVHDLRSVGLRFFNVYGPRQDPSSPYSGVISIFCRRISEGLPVRIHGTGDQLRDFVYVTDAVAALRAAMDRRAAKSDVFNVCTGCGTSITRLGEIISEMHETRFLPEHRPARPNDVYRSVGDPRRASEMLSFEARTSLQSGLARILDWTGRNAVL